MTVKAQLLKNFFLICACFLSFVAGLCLPAAHAGLSQSLALLQEISLLLQAQAFQSPAEQSLWEGAVRGLLQGLGDPYSYYLTPQEFSEFKQIKSGELAGVGMEVGIREGRLTVISVLEQSPAGRAGILAGDQIIRINQRNTQQLKYTEALQLLQGEEGSWLELEILRPGSQGFRRYRLQREKLKLEPVVYRMLPENIGYIRLFSFLPDQVPEAVQTALDTLQTEGMEALILDLRNNPGGTLANAVEVGSLFLSQGPIVRVQNRHAQETVYAATGLPRYDPDMALIVLVNGGTASAAEIVAGSLQEQGRALLVGTPTFGKGLVQSLLPLANRGGLSLTTSRYLTSQGRDIHGLGIQPDVLQTLPVGIALGSEQDTQLAEALKRLKKMPLQLP